MIRYPPDGVHIGTGMLYLDKYRNSITATPIVLRMETVVNGLQQLSSCLLFTLPNLFMINLLTQGHIYRIITKDELYLLKLYNYICDMSCFGAHFFNFCKNFRRISENTYRYCIQIFISIFSEYLVR